MQFIPNSMSFLFVSISINFNLRLLSFILFVLLLLVDHQIKKIWKRINKTSIYVSFLIFALFCNIFIQWVYTRSNLFTKCVCLLWLLKRFSSLFQPRFLITVNSRISSILLYGIRTGIYSCKIILIMLRFIFNWP